MRSVRILLSGAPALLALSSGCVGNLGDTSKGEGAGEPGADALLDPGRVTLHRLNRAEYNNTVQALLGTTLSPADDFPSDDFGYGFDNIADVLTLSPTQLELYERAAEDLVEGVFAAAVPPIAIQHEAEDLEGTSGGPTADGYNLSSNGEVSATVEVPSDGTYTVSVRLWGQQAGPDPAQAEIKVGALSLGTFDVPNTSSDPLVLEVDTTLTAGSKVVAVAFLNDFYDEAAGADRNLVVDWIRVEGPLGAGLAPNAVVACDLSGDGPACARESLQKLAYRAFRRPVTDAEVDGLMTLVTMATDQGDDIVVGLKLAMRAILVSPHFLYRVEIDPDPLDTTPHPLSDFELASRLSYFLWSSMPDDALFAAAEEGLLADPLEIAAQVDRMLDDPKADELAENFAGQWLFTRGLVDHQPDYLAFPTFDEELRAAMQTETRLFFQEFLKTGLSVTEMLDTDFTFVDDRLAEHYGVSAPSPGEFAKVTFANGERVGLLTQGSILTVTSYPTRTSPVKRGKWILGQVLCSAPPPPPPGVEGEIDEASVEGMSLREQLEKHREDPECAACHAAMDPLGLGLENFDGIGAYRTADGEFPVDASGELPGGEVFSGYVEMASLLSADARFVPCLTKQLATYAVGRGMKLSDRPYLEAIDAAAREEGYGLRSIIRHIATSEPFRMRHGEPEGGEK